MDYKITLIESLLGNAGEHCIFGMLSKLSDGNYHIEDLTSSIVVDLTSTELQSVISVHHAAAARS